MFPICRTERASQDVDAARGHRGARRLQRFTLTFIVVAFAAILTSCSVSQNALSSPEDAKPDPRLVGVWRPKEAIGLLRCPQVVHVVGGKLPASVVRIDDSQPGEKTEKARGTYLGFPTTIGGHTYLNLAFVGKDEQVKALKDKGWDPNMVTGYLLMKYTINGKVLRLQPMSPASLGKAIRAGRLKGEIAEEKNEANINPMANAISGAIRDPISVIITDTSDNLRRLIAASEITFLEEKDGAYVFERVE